MRFLLGRKSWPLRRAAGLIGEPAQSIPRARVDSLVAGRKEELTDLSEACRRRVANDRRSLKKLVRSRISRVSVHLTRERVSLSTIRLTVDQTVSVRDGPSPGPNRKKNRPGCGARRLVLLGRSGAGGVVCYSLFQGGGRWPT
jgi:hypothetical protein